MVRVRSTPNAVFEYIGVFFYLYNVLCILYVIFFVCEIYAIFMHKSCETMLLHGLVGLI